MRDARCGSVDGKPNFIYVQVASPEGPIRSKYWDVAPSLACADAHPYPSMPCALFLAGCVPVPALASASSCVLPWCGDMYIILPQPVQLHGLAVLCKYHPGIGETPKLIPIEHQMHHICSVLHARSIIFPMPAYTFHVHGLYEACTHPPSPQQPPANWSMMYNWGPILRA